MQDLKDWETIKPLLEKMFNSFKISRDAIPLYNSLNDSDHCSDTILDLRYESFWNVASNFTFSDERVCEKFKLTEMESRQVRAFFLNDTHAHYKSLFEEFVETCGFELVDEVLSK